MNIDFDECHVVILRAIIELQRTDSAKKDRCHNRLMEAKGRVVIFLETYSRTESSVSHLLTYTPYSNHFSSSYASLDNV